MRICQKKNKYPAFSIIEVMIALFMFMVAIVTTVGFMNGEVWNSRDRRNEVSAGQLSQEGIELVRNIRDNNWLQSKAAFTNIGDAVTTGDYVIDSATPTLQAFTPGSGGNSVLYVSNATGLYTGSSANAKQTVFNRKITVGATVSHQKLITSMVVWDGVVYPSKANCDVSAHCFYSEVTLSDDWGAVK